MANPRIGYVRIAPPMGRRVICSHKSEISYYDRYKCQGCGAELVDKGTPPNDPLVLVQARLLGDNIGDLMRRMSEANYAFGVLAIFSVWFFLIPRALDSNKVAAQPQIHTEQSTKATDVQPKGTEQAPFRGSDTRSKIRTRDAPKKLKIALMIKRSKGDLLIGR